MEAIKFIEKEIEYLKIKNAKARLKGFNEERIKSFVDVSIELRRYKLLLENPLLNMVEKLAPHTEAMLGYIKYMAEIKITTPAEFLQNMEGILLDKDLIEAIEIKLKNKEVIFKKDYILITLQNTRVTLDQEYLIKNKYTSIDYSERKNNTKWRKCNISVDVHFNGIYYTEIELHF